MVKIYVRCLGLGGLGNQLFSYALYYYLKSNGKEVCLVSCHDGNKSSGFGIDLTKAFEIDFKLCEDLDQNHNSFSLFNKVIDRVNYSLLKRIDVQFIGENRTLREYMNFEKNRKLFELDCVRLEGVWNRENYLNDIRIALQSELQFNIPRIQSSYLDELIHDETILIHVRGGDYVSNGWILSVEYYLRALKMFSHFKNPKYFIITNDNDYLSMLKLPIEYKIIDDYEGENSYSNMYLFSRAKNIILANSSFSWWGAYLNPDSNIVTVPKKWLPVPGYETLQHPSEWIRT